MLCWLSFSVYQICVSHKMRREKNALVSYYDCRANKIAGMAVNSEEGKRAAVDALQTQNLKKWDDARKILKEQTILFETWWRWKHIEWTAMLWIEIRIFFLSILIILEVLCWRQRKQYLLFGMRVPDNSDLECHHFIQLDVLKFHTHLHPTNDSTNIVGIEDK